MSIDKLEQINYRDTKLVPHLPYKARLQHLNLHSLYCWRQRGDLIEVLQVGQPSNLSFTRTVFILVNSVIRGHNYRISKQHCKINPRLKFFTKRIINQWNSLSCYVITSDSLNKFKNNLDKYWSEIGYGQTKRPLAY